MEISFFFSFSIINLIVFYNKINEYGTINKYQRKFNVLSYSITITTSWINIIITVDVKLWFSPSIKVIIYLLILTVMQETTAGFVYDGTRCQIKTSNQCSGKMKQKEGNITYLE